MSNRKILLADDSITIQKVVNLTFADEGIEVIAVGDGNAAMEKFVESVPDLVMVDVNMPGFDGYKICEMIKQDEETKHIPVILLVGSFEPFDEEEARRVGADDFLTKPFQSIRQLVGKVSALLDAAASGKNNSESQQMPELKADEAVSPQNENTDAVRDEMPNEIPAESNSAENAAAPPQFDNAETNDDEMIQTNQIGSLPADEAQKFSAGFASENSSQIAVANLAENSVDYEAEENDWAKTQPLSSAESDEINQTSDAPDSSNKNAGDDKNLNAREITSPSRNYSDWKFDDEINLLELSPAENAFRDYNKEIPETIPQTEEEISDEAIPQAEPEMATIVEPQENNQPPEAASTAAEATLPQNVSPEIIDAIAAKVAEKLSDKMVREIVSQVVPQVTDSILRQMGSAKSDK